ncbi:MAG TPA: hypothetical protein VJ846_08530, partial [Sphingomicrobium sp.]|nr:hypothetical protein [Sphingomicrobium sp.]
SAIASGDPQDAQTQIPSPWIMLTSLSASQTGADTGQPSELPPGPHGHRAAPDEFLGGTAPVLPLVVWIGLVAIILSTNHNSHFIRPNSPA